MPSAKITKQFVEKQPLQTSGQVLWWDTELPGFGLRIGQKTKAFFAEAKIYRKTIRYTVGTSRRMTPEVARQEAKSILQDMERGIDPRKARQPVPTLSDAYEAFKKTRQLAARTLYDYDRFLEKYFANWRQKGINEISHQAVGAKHLEIRSAIIKRVQESASKKDRNGKRRATREVSDTTGQVQANLAMRFLRSLLNFCRSEYGEELVPKNPVKALGEKRQWFREPPRRNVIRAHQLPAWFKGVLGLKNDDTSQDRETVRDLLLLMLFLGLRRSEALNLRWADVDLSGRMLTIPKTKSHEPKVLPLGPYVTNLLRQRLINSGGVPFVFASSVDSRKPIVEFRKSLAQVTRVSGWTFTPHDLRRSFATYLDSLDVPAFALRRLLGHKTRGDDVAEHHYVVTDVERLRPAIEKLETFILSAAGIKPMAQVADLAAKRKGRQKVPG